MKKKVATTSSDIQLDNLAKLRSIFPQFVKDNQVDFDALQAFMQKEGILAGEEKYGLSWAGKSNAFRAIRTPSTGTLVPQKEESKNWEETKNIFIEGDNLEVLKLLQKHYTNPGLIKMIYIDPPYNTGKDFVYKDNFHQGMADYYEQTGQTKGGIKMKANTDKSGRYHSDWLTMMYPRLFLARNLLRDDGVIFVSIDDNEVANLRQIMDEIFGEENFIGSFVWKRRASSAMAANNFSLDHEYVLVYRKNALFNFLGVNKDFCNFSNPDNDSRGRWTLGDLTVGMTRAQRPNQYYDLINPETGLTYKPNPNRVWAYIPSSMEKLINEKRVYFPNSASKRPMIKRYENELKDKNNPISSWMNKVGLNSEGGKAIKNIFDTLIFDYSKPVSLIHELVKATTEKDDIIFDFFAGSGTTAHAVMALNSEDEGNRRCISVQLPEFTEEGSEAHKAGFTTIADIARERIRRAGEKIIIGDIGFKSYKLTSSNYRRWQNLTEENDEEDVIKQSKLFLEKPLVDRYKEEDVAYEVLLKEGFDLNSVESKKNNSLTYYHVQDGEKELIITFAPKLSLEEIESLNLSDTTILACLDSALDDTTKINISKNFKLKVI